MFKLTLMDRVIRGKHQVVRLKGSSDWASKNPWKDAKGKLPYFWYRFEENSGAEAYCFGAGPFVLIWAYAK